MTLNRADAVNRLVIYFLRDAEGVVDRYVPYLLNDMGKNCSEMLVICNADLAPQARNALLETGAKVCVNKAAGSRLCAYREGLAYLGRDRLEQFDEAVLMDSTLFGPLYPFSGMFERMDRADLDFWGLTMCRDVSNEPAGADEDAVDYIPLSFLCVRRAMLGCREFYDFLESAASEKPEAARKDRRESAFTDKFVNSGFRCGAYIFTDDMKTVTGNPLLYISTELVRDYRCPVLSFDSFDRNFLSYLSCSVGEAAVESMNYIRGNLDYDTDMIWEHVIRTANMACIKDCMHLNFILPKHFAVNGEDALDTKTALFMHVYYPDLIDSSIEQAENMPDNSDIYFISPSEKNIEVLRERAKKLAPRKVRLIKAENRGRDVSALIVAAAPYIGGYDVICFAHDKKTKQVKPYINGLSWAYQCFENILGSRAYVKNIITKFKQEKRLGIAMPPVPIHGGFYGVMGFEWGPNYDNTVELARKLGVRAPMDIDCEPIAPLGTMFWCRPDALKPLYSIEWKYTDFPEEPNANDGTLLHAFERLYSYAAQSRGYYAAWIMNDSFAAIAMTDYHFIAREASKYLFHKFGRQGVYPLLKVINEREDRDGPSYSYEDVVGYWKSSLEYSELLEKQLSGEQKKLAEAVESWQSSIDYSDLLQKQLEEQERNNAETVRNWQSSVAYSQVLEKQLGEEQRKTAETVKNWQCALAYIDHLKESLDAQRNAYEESLSQLRCQLEAQTLAYRNVVESKRWKLVHPVDSAKGLLQRRKG